MLKYLSSSKERLDALPHIFLTFSTDANSDQIVRLARAIQDVSECVVCVHDSVPTPRELSNMQLIVCLVTKGFLTGRGRQETEALEAARRCHIPVLPIIPEPLGSTLTELYTTVFGKLPAVYTYSRDFSAALADLLSEKLLNERTRQAVCLYIDKFGTQPRLRTPISDYLLGMAALNGIMSPPDRENAVRLLGQSAETGYIPAMKQLAVMYGEGIGIPRDPLRATGLQKRVAETALAALAADGSEQHAIRAAQECDRLCALYIRSEQEGTAIPYAEKILAIYRAYRLPQLERIRLEALCDICCWYAAEGSDEEYLRYAPEYTAVCEKNCGDHYADERGFRYAEALSELTAAYRRASMDGLGDYSAEISANSHKLLAVLNDIFSRRPIKGNEGLLDLAMEAESYLAELDPPEIHKDFHDTAVEFWLEKFKHCGGLAADCWESATGLAAAADFYSEKLHDPQAARRLYLMGVKILSLAEYDEEFTPLSCGLECAEYLRRAGECSFAVSDAGSGNMYFDDALKRCRDIIERYHVLFTDRERREADMCLWDVFETAYRLCEQLAGYGSAESESAEKNTAAFDTLLCEAASNGGLVLGWRLIISFGQMFCGFPTAEKEPLLDIPRLSDGISRLTALTCRLPDRLHGAVYDEIVSLYYFMFDACMDNSDPDGALASAEKSDEVYRGHKIELHDKGFDYHLALLQKAADLLVGESMNSEAADLLTYLTEECRQFVKHGVIAPDDVYYLDVVRTYARAAQTLGIVYTGEDRRSDAAEAHAESIRLYSSLMERSDHLPDDEFWFAAACFELAMADPDERQEELMEHARSIAEALAEEFPENAEYQGLKADFDSFFPANY